MFKLKERLSNANFAPVTRKRIYSTGALLGSVLVVWGAISAEDLAQLKDSLPEFLGALGFLLARKNVSVPE